MQKLKKDINILFLNGRVPSPLNVGGDGISIDTFLRILQKRGYSIDCHGVINSYFDPKTLKEAINKLDKIKINYKYDKDEKSISYEYSYPVTIHTKIDLEKFIDDYKEKHQKFVILTQLDLARDILEICLKLNIPTVVFIRDAEKNNYLTIGKLKKPEQKVHFAFNSNFTREKFREVEKYAKTSTIYPPLVLKKYIPLKMEPKFITMINPVKVKGGSIFYDLATKFPNERFLVVKGWYDPLNDDLDFSKLKNVQIWEKQDDVRKVYEITKLLLVPSQWEEGFGRVAAEGLVAGIPVIASKKAGLKDALGNIGYYVENFSSVPAWVDKVQEVLGLSEGDLFNHTSKGKEFAKRFNAELLTDQLEKIIKKVFE